MKKIVLILTVLIGMISLNGADGFANGTGTELDPYQITTAAELDNVRNYMGSSKFFILMNNVSLGSAPYSNWVPIGTISAPFHGKFNGNSFRINDLKIDRWNTSDNANVGLFGVLGSNGIIENLNVLIPYVYGAYNVGGLVGRNNGGEINNCSIIGTIEGIGTYSSSAGGIVGQNDSGSNISNCVFSGNVDGKTWIGGIVGYNNGELDSNYSKGTVSGDGTDIGGLIGCNYWTGGTSAYVTNCYSSSTVGGQGNVMGGLIGYNNQGHITNCYSTGTVDMYGYATIDGGLIGKNYFGTYTNSYWNTSSSYKNTSAGGEPKDYWEMRLKSTFIGWDFTNKWSIFEQSSGYLSYPYLTAIPENPIPGLYPIFSAGTGEENSPWQISSAFVLSKLNLYLGDDNADKYFILMNDIDMAPYLTPGSDGYNDGDLWLPIGNLTDQFKGKFNGNGYKVSALQINREAENYIGLFGYIGTGGKVDNLFVEVVESTLIKGSDYVGSLAGLNNGTLDKCFAAGLGIISGSNNAGGLAGSNTGIIRDSYAKMDIARSSGENTSFGGFVGYNNQGKVLKCYSTGSVKYTGASPETQTDKGFCGSINAGGDYEMAGNFWDKITSGATTTSGNAIGKTTVEMTTDALELNYSTNIFLNAGWDFKGESTNGSSNIWNIGNSRNNDYPYHNWQYPNDPPELIATHSTQSIPPGIPDPDPIDFTGTGVTIDFSGVSGATGSNDVTVSRYNETPTNLGGLIGSEINIAGTSYLITNHTGFSFNSTLQFLVNELPGVNYAFFTAFENGTPTDIKLWKRPEYGTGDFINHGYLLYHKGADNTNSTADDYLYLDGITDFSEITFSSDGDHPLPVSLSSFFVEYGNNGNVVYWKTQSETDNLGWFIYRSEYINGFNEGNYIQVNSACIAGMGNSFVPTEYSYVDEYLVIENHTYYYWLQSVSFSLELDLYGPVAVSIPNPGETPSLQPDTYLTGNFPNPFNPSTTIKLAIGEGQSGVLSIFNIKGEKILTQKFEAGNHDFIWDADQYPSGIYFYKLNTDYYAKTRKMIMLK